MSRSSNSSDKVYPIVSVVSPGKDLLFYEKVNSRQSSNIEESLGSAHHNTAQWNGYSLVFITPDSDPNYWRFYYAAPRSDQDDYNFEFSSVSIGGRKFNSVRRTYVELRSAWSESSPAIGVAMSRAPSNKFPVGYVLAERQTRKITEELDSLFVLEIREYIEKTTIGGLKRDDRTGGMFREETTLYARGEQIGGVNVEDLVGDETHSYWDNQGSGLVRYGEQLSEDWFAVVVRRFDAGAPLSGERTSPWGVLDSTVEVVTEGTAADHAEGIAESQVEPRGDGMADKRVIEYPAADGDGVIAMLSDQDDDDTTGIITDIDKLLVQESDAATIIATRRGNGWWVEKDQQDQNHSILICSKVDLSSLPEDEVYYDSDSIRLPDTLQSLTIIWNEQKGGGNETASSESGGAFSGSARGSASVSLSASVGIGLTAGFRGRAKVKVTRSYGYGPPASLIDAFNIIPSVGSIAINGASASVTARVTKTVQDGGVGSSMGTQQSVGGSGRMVQIGPFLSAGVSAVNAGTKTISSGPFYGSNQGAFAYATATATGEARVTLPASNPPSIASGDVVARWQKARKWRLGIWITETYEVYAP